jgi:HAD superfamily phosphatase (TIGR01668 family)
MFRLVTPHYRVHRVEELTPARLRQWKLGALLLDVDCTLSRYHQDEAPPLVAAWVEELRLAGVRLCLVSNGGGPRIRQFARRLRTPCVSMAMKPFPWGLRAAMDTIRSLPLETAIVGDQIFADVMAGRLAGIRAILVDPIHPEEEPWFTRLKRLPERAVLARLGWAGGNCAEPGLGIRD